MRHIMASAFQEKSWACPILKVLLESFCVDYHDQHAIVSWWNLLWVEYLRAKKLERWCMVIWMAVLPFSEGIWTLLIENRWKTSCVTLLWADQKMQKVYFLVGMRNFEHWPVSLYSVFGFSQLSSLTVGAGWFFLVVNPLFICTAVVLWGLLQPWLWKI